MVAVEQSYTERPAGSPAPGAAGAPGIVEGEYWPLDKMRRCVTDYLFSKREEIDEQKEARRYYHGSQYTKEQVKSLTNRNQPVLTFNRIGRKIDGVIGLIEKLRQDPKAYARTPQHEQGADLATAALRYVLDEQRWKEKSPLIASDGAVDGIGGLELDLEQGDRGDPEIGFRQVDIPSFFYDPRSYMDDFSDARYMGVNKWVDDDIAKEMFPDADLAAFGGGDTDLINTSDREMRWFSVEGIQRRVRIVEMWYQHRGGWCWAVFSGTRTLREGHSPLFDEKGQSQCKYIMYSGNVDQDGDRYGFVRNMKSAQDGINAKQSKMQHIIHSKRIILTQGAVDDIEKTRTEWARPDGVLMINRPDGVKLDDQTFDFAGLSKLLELNLNEIENFGPNPALIGQGIENRSGRAIALLQQAGMAELGPYILAYRGWKIRVYRMIWNAISRFWQAERWIRVTDSEGLAQFVQVNKLAIDPRTGIPTIVNALGSLDVDIIMDEAPDAITLQAQSFDVLQALGPQFMQQFPDIAIELSPLDSATKKLIRDRREQAAQATAPQQQMAAAAGQAKVGQMQADAGLKQAQAEKTMVEARLAPRQSWAQEMQAQLKQPLPEIPPELQIAQAAADVQDTRASAAHKTAQAAKAAQEAAMAPFELEMERERNRARGNGSNPA